MLRFCEEANLAVYLGECFTRDIGSLIRIVAHKIFEICFISHQSLEFSLQRSQSVCASFADSHFEIAVALALEFSFDLLEGLAREAGIDGHQVIDAVLAVRVTNDGIAIRYGALDFIVKPFKPDRILQTVKKVLG